MKNLFLLTSFLASVALPMPAAFGQQGYIPSCWTIGDMRGATILQDEAYKLEQTTMNGPITLLLDGDNSSISTPDMRVQQVDDLMALVFSASHSATNFEVFQIDPSAGLAIFTKNMRVKGMLGGLSGATALVGPVQACRR